MNNVRNMLSNQGNSIANQFIITTELGEMFQSYQSAIALKTSDGVVHLSEHREYSATTMKYLSLFLGHGIDITRKRIERGGYKTDLSIQGDLIK